MPARRLNTKGPIPEWIRGWTANRFTGIPRAAWMREAALGSVRSMKVGNEFYLNGADVERRAKELREEERAAASATG